MPALLDYLEYREYLRDVYTEKHARDHWFSYRYIGNRIGMDSSYFIRVVQGKKHLSDEYIPRISKLLKHNSEEERYFENLVYFNKARTTNQAERFLEELYRIRRVRYNPLQKDRQEYFSYWYYVALRNVLDFFPFQDDYETLGKQLDPPISESQARKGVKALQRLGLIEQQRDKSWLVLDDHLHSGDKWEGQVIRRFQEQTLKLAQKSLKEHPREHRDMSTMTMNISATNLRDIRELIRDFQASVARLVEETPESDRVYQFNMQLFPLTRIPENVKISEGGEEREVSDA